MLELYLALKKRIKKKFEQVHDRFDNIESSLNTISLTLHSINLKLVIIEGKEDTMISQVAQDFESLRVALDDATTKVGLKIASFGSLVKNSMTDAEVATLKSEFTATAAQLTALAADPSNPVPVTSDPIVTP